LGRFVLEEVCNEDGSGDGQNGDRDFATARARSLRVAFVPIVIFLVAVVLLFVVLFFIWLFSKEDIGGYGAISGSRQVLLRFILRAAFHLFLHNRHASPLLRKGLAGLFCMYEKGSSLLSRLLSSSFDLSPSLPLGCCDLLSGGNRHRSSLWGGSSALCPSVLTLQSLQFCPSLTLGFCYARSARGRNVAVCSILFSVYSTKRRKRRRNSLKLIGQPFMFSLQYPDNITHVRH
jgi:hypothetical protein